VTVAVLDSNPEGEGHGRAVAQTILASCPQARILAVPILGETGLAKTLDAVEGALRWSLDNAEREGIGLLCAALSDGANHRNDAAFRAGETVALVQALRVRGIVTVASAGNGFLHGRRRRLQGMGHPAILREVVSVGALDAGPDGFQLWERSQRLAGAGPARTTILVRPGPPGGTSGAAARVTGLLAAGVVSGLDGETALARLLARAGSVEDDTGRTWPALLE
jgi:hypothetical protein